MRRHSTSIVLSLLSGLALVALADGCSVGGEPTDTGVATSDVLATMDAPVLDGGTLDGAAGDTFEDASLGGSLLDAPAPADDAAGPRLELGEGDTTFRPIADGDTLLLARGCQGSQHVWISLRAHELLPRAMIVGLELVRASDGTRVSSDFLARISFADDPAGFAVLYGATLQVPAPDPELGVDLVLRGTVEDTTHRMAMAERRVRIAWGTEVCAL